MRKETKNKIVVLVLAVIAGLFLVNIFLQISGIDLEIPEKYWNEAKNIHEIVEGKLLYELKKNITETADTIIVKTNSMGFRDKEYFPEKGKNTTRIIVLGDSVTFGARVNQNKTYSDILEQLLNTDSSRKYEVWNTGVGGYNAYQEMLTLEKTLKYEPDIVVLGFFQNDIRDPSELKFYRDDFLKKNKLIAVLDKTLISKISIYRLITKNIYNEQKKNLIKRYNEEWHISSAENELAVFEIINITKQKNISLIILNIPYLEENKHYGPKEENVIEKVREKHEVIDIIESYKKFGTEYQNYTDEPYYYVLRAGSLDFIHPNDIGHILIAETLYEEIKKDEKQ